MKNAIKAIVSVGIIVAVLAIVLHGVSLRELGQAFARVQWSWFMLGMAVCLVIF